MVKLFEYIVDMVSTVIFALWIAILTMFSLGKSCMAKIIFT